MPLVHSPNRLQKGDLVVYLYYPALTVRFDRDLPREELEDTCYDWIEASLGVFHDVRNSSFYGTGDCYTMTRYSRCKFDAASYSGYDFTTFRRRLAFETLYSPGAVSIFGIVSGHFDYEDPHESRRFFRRLIKRYRPVFLREYSQYLEEEVECHC